MTLTTSARHATARDLSVNAAILGFAAAAWFGWAQQAPPPSWTMPLTIGSILGLVVCALAGLSAWRSRQSGSAMDAESGRRTYYWTVGVEGASIVVGAVALTSSGQSAFIAPWVLFVVGVHFLPLSNLFAIRSLAPAGVLLVVVSAIAVVVGLLGTVAPSAVAGGIGGLVLVAFAAASLLAARR